MATKTITIVEDAYNALKREKMKDESFSKTILRLTQRRGSLMDSVGAWKHMTDKEEKRIKKIIEKGWKGSDREIRKMMK